MAGVNVRLGGLSHPITVRMPVDLVSALNEAGTNSRSVSHLVREILEEYLNINSIPGVTQYERLNYAAGCEQRSIGGLIRNILRQEMDTRGYLNYEDVPYRLAVS